MISLPPEGQAASHLLNQFYEKPGRQRRRLETYIGVKRGARRTKRGDRKPEGPRDDRKPQGPRDDRKPQGPREGPRDDRRPPYYKPP